jgi:GNAT superfamily N-acetyltransferase
MTAPRCRINIASRGCNGRSIDYRFSVSTEWGVMTIDVAAGSTGGRERCETRAGRPEYDSWDPAEDQPVGYRIKIARDFEDMAKVFAIRGSACFSDPEHLYAKHFDGNDFSSTHLLGYVDGEPVATIRVRYFADFTRIERLTVRPTHRRSRISFKLAKASFAWCRDKGYRTLTGVAREELVPFWSMLGFRLTEGKEAIFIYGLPHFDMTMTLGAGDGTITAATDTMVLLRPEGRWREAGHHETINATRPAGVVPTPPMVARARRPADLADRLARRLDASGATIDAVPPARLPVAVAEARG